MAGKALADILTGGKYSRSGWVSLAGRGVEKVRLSGREALAGVRWESDGRSRLSCRTGKDWKGKVGWPGGTRRDLTGGWQLAAWMGETSRPQGGKGKFLAGRLWS